MLRTLSKEVEIFWDTLPMLWGRFAIVREARESLSFYSVFFFPGGSAKCRIRPGTWRPSASHHAPRLKWGPSRAVSPVSVYGALRDVFPSPLIIVLCAPPHRRSSCSGQRSELYRRGTLHLGGFLLRRRSFCAHIKGFVRSILVLSHTSRPIPSTKIPA